MFMRMAVQHPMILDAKADPEKVGALLSRLQSRMDGLHERAATYKNYQKTFKVSTYSPRAAFSALFSTHSVPLVL